MNIIKKGQTVILFSAMEETTSLSLQDNLEEMTELALSAGLHPLCKLWQNLKNVDSAFLIGTGKREELKQKVKELKPHYVIFDHNLSGVQIRNLEKLLKIHVLDRTQLILEIFAKRAKSHEGRLQVELAQLMDQMPRMVGAWLGSLSRQGSGGRARGPGEKALEVDRREAQNRIHRVKAQLEKVKQSRIQHRQLRRKNNVPAFGLIGYTNSGKSALFNYLTKFQVETKDQVFMTLDPKTRKLFIPGTSGAVLTDTVGFIRKLPPHLISAFKATLEESAVADVLLHVVDVSHPKFRQHIKVVDELVKQFSWNKKPVIYVFNKTDLLTHTKNSYIPTHCKNRVFISAKTGNNIEGLLLKIKEAIEELCETVKLFFPAKHEYKIYDLSRQANIFKKEVEYKGTFCSIKILSRQISQWKDYIVIPQEKIS